MTTKCVHRKRWYSLRSTSRKLEMPYCSIEEMLVFWGREHKCEYCGIKQCQLDESLHIDRKDPRVGYVIGNMVFACRKCNLVKNSILTFEEMKEIGKKYIKPKYSANPPTNGN